MSWQSILLSPIHPNIQRWLTDRPVGPDGKKPWYRITSNAVVDGDTSLRTKHRLTGPYTTLGANLPGAGITNIVVQQKGLLGSLREANVSFRVFDPAEMSILEKLFLVPGISVTLEWGWTGVVLPNIDASSGDTMEGLQRRILKKALGVTTDQALITEVATGDPLLSGAGQYDGMVGVVTNFTKNSTDRGFECSVKLSSVNGILSSQPIKMQKYDVQIDRVLKASVGGDGESEIGSSETLHLTDVDSILYALEYPGSVVSKPVTIPIVSTLDNANQPYETYEFKYSKGFEELQSRIPINLAGEQYSFVNSNDTQVNEDLTPEVGHYVFRSTTNYIGPKIGTDVISERGPASRNFAWTMPIRYQKLATRFAETDQFTYQTYVSWRFIEDVICTKVIANHYGDLPRMTVASLDILSHFPGGNYWAEAESRKIRNLPELRSADPTVCLLPGQLYAGELGTDFLRSLPTSNHYFFNEVVKRGIFPFPSNQNPGAMATRNDPESFRVAGNPNQGYLRNILVNSDVVRNAYLNSDTLSGFLQSILDSISEACGNFWDFHVIANPNRPQLLEVIDEKTVEDKQSKHYLFRVNTTDTKIKNFSTTSKLPSSAGALAFIGARSTTQPAKENSVNVGDSVAFLGYSNGVTDLFTKNEPRPSSSPAKSLNSSANTPSPTDQGFDGLSAEERIELIQDQAELDLFVDLPPREKWLNAYANLLMRHFATPELRQQAKDTLSGFLIKDHERQSYVDDPASPSFLLPIEFNMTMDGVSGVFMGNSFMINTYSEGGPLPDRYKGKVAFQITGVDHKIGDTWETEITGMMRMLDVRKTLTSPKHTRPEFEGHTIVFSSNGLEGSIKGLKSPGAQLTSQANIEALHPAIRDKVRTIMARLQSKGWEPIIATAFRSLQEQKQKVAAGSSQVVFGKHNNIIGTPEAPERASLALDIVDRRYVWGNGTGLDPEKNAALFFIALAREAKKEGFRWGGDWSARSKGTGSEWSKYLRKVYSTTEGFATNINAAGSYREGGWPTSYPRMGWDPAHIEIYKGALGTSGVISTLYTDIPTWQEAKRLSTQLYGIEL